MCTLSLRILIHVPCLRHISWVRGNSRHKPSHATCNKMSFPLFLVHFQLTHKYSFEEVIRQQLNSTYNRSSCYIRAPSFVQPSNSTFVFINLLKRINYSTIPFTFMIIYHPNLDNISGRGYKIANSTSPAPNNKSNNKWKIFRVT